VDVWDGEVIFAGPTAKGPLVRWCGATAATTVGAGTVALTKGSSVVTGTTTDFLTKYTAGQYMRVVVGGGLEWDLLVRSVESNTILTLSSPSPFTGSSLTYRFRSFAQFNLCSEVDRAGTISTSGATATGVGTLWTSTIDAEDIVGLPQDGATAGSIRHQVSGGVTDTGFSLSAAPSPAWAGGSKYIAVRRLAGHVVCKHQNRLWVAGHYVFPNRVQVTPAGFRLNDAYNGLDSEDTNAIEACIAESIDIPEAEPSEGRIVALASLNEPGPLLILRDRDAYILYGEWPSVQVTKLGDELGAIHWASVATMDGAAYWAGPDGVFRYRPGGGVTDITLGRVRRQYLDLVRALPTAAPNSTAERVPVVVTGTDGHVLVCVGNQPDPTSSTTFAYDVAGDRWSTWTGPVARSASIAAFPDRSYEAFVTDPNINRVIAVSTAMKPALAGEANGVRGVFLARSGRMLLGQAGDLGRIIDAKITYRLTGTLSPAFTVKFGSVTMDTAATVTTVTSGTAYNTIRVRPGSTLMGTNVRDVQVEFTESAGTLTRLELNEFSWVARLRRPRA
jgi:hypothetical protein